MILVEHENDIAFETEDFTHFLSCPEGENILRQWLSADLEDDMKSYDAAKQAAISLAFLRSSDWREFIQIARNHPDANVVLEGAWAGARRQHEESISHLVELAKDVRYSRTAVNYLNELSLESRVPTETTSPEFADPHKLARKPLDNGVLTFPFFTIENVDVVDAKHIVVGNDNNLPFSSSRLPNKADDNEMILLEVAEFLRAK